MSDIIQLLPDHISNQIAAGEVVQRPASAVKELMENAVDAGANRIELTIKDGGKTLIRVMDNGSGMSFLDARMCFERHATSKITKADDLFSLQTKGFRGEAMATIAAIAQVELKTKRKEDELGTEIEITGSDVRYHRTCTATNGTLVNVRNLFFNVPARRNFLKSTSVEAKHVINEFLRLALAHSEISFRLEHQDALIYDFPAADVLNRILQVFGSDTEADLILLEEHTPYVTIQGYIGMPESARKLRGDQYFFVNNRYVKDPSLHHALMSAYQDTLQKDELPLYVLYLTLDPKHIDINIHPTKTEIKFDDQQAVYAILKSSVRKALGMFHMHPEEQNLNFAGPGLSSGNHSSETTLKDFQQRRTSSRVEPEAWQSLFQSATQKSYTPQPPPVSVPLFQQKPAQEQAEQDVLSSEVWVIQNAYLMTSIPAGLMMIDPIAAHQAVLYHRFMEHSQTLGMNSQQLLYPQNLEFTATESEMLKDREELIRSAGFDLRPFGKQTWLLSGLPAEVKHTDARSILESFLSEPEGGNTPKHMLREKLAKSISKGARLPSDTLTGSQHAKHLVQAWKRAGQPAYCPSGKPVFWILPLDEIRKRFR
jgi:DNA mismatch repair protein MutL